VETPEPSRPGRRAAWLGLLMCGLLACASGPPPAPPPPEWNAGRLAEALRLEHLLAEAPSAVAGGLELRLAFPGDVDLDLYVTDPQLETLYYANTPVRSGGELLEDRRCDGDPDGVPRIETARFAAPLTGRYRVGVDHPSSCRGGADVAPYLLSIETPEGRRRLRGLSERLRFDSIVIEFDWP
jgi:hypothetical protein